MLLHPKQILQYLAALDKVSLDYAVKQKIPEDRAPVTIFMVAMSWSGFRYALLYHCVIDGERRTYMKGHCWDLGLREYIYRGTCLMTKSFILLLVK